MGELTSAKREIDSPLSHTHMSTTVSTAEHARLPAPAIAVMARSSGLRAHGVWMMAYGVRLRAQGAGRMAQGRGRAHGPWLRAHG